MKLFKVKLVKIHRKDWKLYCCSLEFLSEPKSTNRTLFFFTLENLFSQPLTVCTQSFIIPTKQV